ncbi:MAG: hypothetical protein PVF43_10910 [Candidatus Eiseniibacteriota bacterium]|jgi:hypothetical protein
MIDHPERRVFEQGLGFFGAITASLSHEMNNVLAIVNELSGLQDDCLVAAERGRPLDPARLRSVAGRIAEQVERGKSFVKQLNGFAHCIDRPGVMLDVQEQVEAVTALCQRFARLRRLTLAARPATSTCHVVGCAFELQHLLYRAIEHGLAQSAEGESIGITVELADGGGARITVTAGASSGGAVAAAAATAATAAATAAADTTNAPRAGVTDGEDDPGEREVFLERFASLLGGRACCMREGTAPLAIVLELPAELRHVGGAERATPGAPHEDQDDRGGRDR